ncbi:hypothetical protein [Streptomyces sp. URMC 123]|uniref:hypothetical protein n=1 Tax=Streptomyces sp. URMC 123 TaxID=3423403 RepID=UPI003F1A0404
MPEYEWDRTAMAAIAAALADDAEGAAALLEPLDAKDLRHVVIRLAATLADTLLTEARRSGASREEVVANWQACILDHETKRGH